jgi:putative DNA primase/helicase
VSRAAKKAILVATVDYWALAWYELNDDGNALRLLARAIGRLVHVREWGWLAYDGQRWSSEDGKRLANLMALEVSRGMRDEIAALREREKMPPLITATMRDDRILNLSAWRVQSGNATKTRSMLEQASNLNEFTRRMADFDADLLAVNCLNKTLRFVAVPAAERISEDAETPEWKVEAAEHDPADHITRVTGCEWNGKAEMAPWEAHIAAVLPSAEVRWYFQKIMGYAALGLREEQIFVMLQGKGGDGKSTTMDVIRTVLGLYAVVGNVKTFLSGMNKDAGAATPELIRFVGDTRLISVGEPKRGQALATNSSSSRAASP